MLCTNLNAIVTPATLDTQKNILNTAFSNIDVTPRHTFINIYQLVSYTMLNVLKIMVRTNPTIPYVNI